MGYKFWRLSAAHFKSDSQFLFVNGFGAHPHSIPGINCSECGPWGGNRVLDFPCPKEFIGDDRLTNREPLDVNEHKKLCQDIQKALQKKGINVKLLPGDYFQPLAVTFPSKPIYDFLWPFLGSVVVSKSVKETFEQNQINGVSFNEIIINKVGNVNPDSKPPIKLSKLNEPEEIAYNIGKKANISKFTPLYEMVITSRGAELFGSIYSERCKECGDQEVDYEIDETILISGSNPEEDIFFAGATLFIIINEKVKEIIIKSNFTNYTIEEILVREQPGP